MFDYAKIKNQLIDYITNGAAEVEDYDIDGAMDFIRSIEPDVQSIDDIDIDEVLIAFDQNGHKDPELICGDGLGFDYDLGDWVIHIDDPASDDIPLGLGEVSRTEAVWSALRFYAECKL